MSLFDNIKSNIVKTLNEVKESDLDEILTHVGEIEDRTVLYVGNGHLRNGVPFISPIGRY